MTNTIISYRTIKPSGWPKVTGVSFYFILFYKMEDFFLIFILFIYLAVPGLSCSMWDQVP